MAWGIGANDVANAMGTSVGSKALTITSAVILASIFEFLGAFLAGGEVTSTIRKGIVDPQLYNDNPEIFIVGMLSSLLAAGSWLLIASYRGWPVSTTHSIVGAIVGFALITKGLNSVSWGVVGNIAASWVTSPLMSATLAILIYFSAKKLILEKADQVTAAVRIIPFYAALVTFVICLVTAKKGLKYVGFQWTDQEVFIFSAILSSFILIISSITLNLKKELLLDKNNDFGGVEAAFAFLMVITACSVAFAHGSNDVANAIGPVAAIVSTVNSENQILTTSMTPPWILFLGAIGIVIGLATLGYRVMQTVGEKITTLTPSMGFSAEMATSVTVILASFIGFPISTTHTLVGAVIGVGIAKSVSKVDFNQVLKIVISWVVTIPTGAIFTIAFYVFLRFILFV
jgi:PiT family inorganic phosphate transporter